MKKHDIVTFSMLYDNIYVEAYVLTVSPSSANITVVLLDNCGAYKKGDRVSIDRSRATFVRVSN